MSKTVVPALLACVLLTSTGCSVQQLTVRSDPPGARVTLTKYGVRQGSGTMAGVGAGAASGGSVEEGPLDIGTTPLQYEFDTEETETSVALPGATFQLRKIYQEGLVRVEKDGVVAERRVKFGGDPIVLDVSLSPGGVAPAPPAAAPAPGAAAVVPGAPTPAPPPAAAPPAPVSPAPPDSP